jgi:hypothetical protein
MESVSAPLTFWAMVAAESVIRMRDFGFRADFDIFFSGCKSDITRFAGAGDRLLLDIWTGLSIELLDGLQSNVSGSIKTLL